MGDVARLGAGTTADQGTFGLSTSPNAGAARANANSLCGLDFLEFANLRTKATGCNTAANCMIQDAGSVNRVCGRFFNSQAGATSTTYCTTAVPFNFRVVLDDSELIVAATADPEFAENITP